MHRALQRTALVAGVALALAACSDDGTRTAPLAPQAAVHREITPLLTCDFTALRAAASAYVSSPRDPIFNLIDDVQHYANIGNTTAVYNVGMNGLARLAVVRGTAQQKPGSTSAQGAAVAIGFLGCMNVGPIPDNLLPNLVKAMDRGGLFEVPGSTPLPKSQTAPVYSRGETPFWAAQPLPGQTWTNTSSKRFLIFGFKTAFGLPQGNLDPLIGPTGFDFRTMPTIGTGASQIVLVRPMVIGSCGLGGTTVRYKHIETILADIPPTCPAGTPPFTTASQSAALFAAPLSLARSALQSLAPKPLHAAAFFAIGRVGGAVSELSPSGAIDVVSAVPRFVSQPANGAVNQAIPGSNGVIRVQLTSLAGTPLPGATVTIQVIPSPGTAPLTFTAKTDHDGLARFPAIRIGAPGSYTLQASGNFDGIAGPTVSSVSFVVQ